MSSCDLIEYLHARLTKRPPGALSVGYSGGLDSSVLLHALASIPVARERGLRAIHVDHGLHADSTQWSEHCKRFASNLGVPIRIARVAVDGGNGIGLEAAARRARMAAFAVNVQPGDTLALAQHADDQAETVLLKLLRGAGPEGLGGMREQRRFRHGWLWRPLLELPRGILREYAQSRKLAWLDDPSNADTRLRRNFLRLEILPQLRRHWPQAGIALAHSATWARAAAEYIDAQARQALDRIRGEGAESLQWKRWLDLPDALRDPLLRMWLRSLGLDEPTHVQVVELQRQLTNATADRMPCLRWANTEIRRYRERIYAMHALKPVPADWEVNWNGSPLALPAGGQLRMEPQPAADAWPELPICRVRLRRGGERFRPAHAAHTRELRTVLQEQAMPPWQRGRVPLVYLGDELVAIGDRLLSDSGQALCARLRTRLIWQQPAGD